MTDELLSHPIPVSAFPAELAVLPLNGGVLLPNARLSLDIEEDHHRYLIEDALAQGRYMGIIQPRLQPNGEKLEMPELYQVGSLGRIVTFTETDEGHYLITLQGVCRFRIKHELPQLHGYRRVLPLWQEFMSDLCLEEEGEFDRDRLLKVLATYCTHASIDNDWSVIQDAPDDVLVDSLAMLCPLKPSEKQALLEVVPLNDRAQMLITLLEMNSMPQSEGEDIRH